MRFHNVQAPLCHVVFSRNVLPLRHIGARFSSLKETASQFDRYATSALAFGRPLHLQCTRRGNEMRRAQAPNIEYTAGRRWAAPAIFLQHRQQVGCHPFTLRIFVVICLSVGLAGNWRCRQRRFRVRSRSAEIYQVNLVLSAIRLSMHYRPPNRAGQISL
jgi:hypothetical protein